MVDNLAEKRQYFPGLMDSAFDLSSGGMGVHLHAVSALATGQELTKGARESVQTSSANYLTNPYVFGWAWRDGINWDPYIKNHPFHHATSPHSNLNINLLHVTRDEYACMENVQLRLLLGGEEALSVANPEALITEADEFKELLLKANSQGLIDAFPSELSQVQIPYDRFSLLVNLLRCGVTVNDSFVKTMESIPFAERFREPLLKASVHKLGAMLGLTDQLTFDARELGVPIPASYKPSGEIERWEANWQRLFGEPMPTLEGLYRQAHTVFIEHSDPNDSLVAHLFVLDTLPQLAA